MTSKTNFRGNELSAPEHRQPFFLLTLPCQLAPGNYYGIFNIHDTGKQEFVVQKEFHITGIPKSTNRMSDILCAAGIGSRKADIQPFPARIYGKFQHKLFSYFEVEKAIRDNPAKFYQLRLLDARDKTILEKIKPLNQSEKQCILDSLNTENLPAGEFHLICTLLDKKQEMLVSQKTELYIYQDPTDANFYSMKSILHNLRFAAPDELLNKIYQAPSVRIQLKMIADFWRQKDPTPATPQNELKEAYYGRLNFVKLNYWQQDQPSDRGKVFLQYGYPDVIREVNDPIQNVDFEIWTYRKTDNIFTFFDERGLGEFRMVERSGILN